MALELVQTVAELELTETAHEARILLLVGALSGRTRKPVKSLNRIAMLDFLVRNPAILIESMVLSGVRAKTFELRNGEFGTIFHHYQEQWYRPEDPRYRRWLARLRCRGVIKTQLSGRSPSIHLTLLGDEAVGRLREATALKRLDFLCRKTGTAFGNTGVNRLNRTVQSAFVRMSTPIRSRSGS